MESALQIDSTVTQAFCSIPSCRSLLPPDSTAFNLPSTGMLVCSACYKLYLNNEYERVIAAERGAVNEKSVENNSAPELGLETDTMEVESPVEQWNMPAVNTQIYPIPNLSNTKYSEEYNYGSHPSLIPPYQLQESNFLCNNDAYQIPSYQPEIYTNSTKVDFSENSAETITYTTLEPASSSIRPLETPITENPGISCQEESIAYPVGEQQMEAQSDKNSVTQEPQSKTIEKGQKCANSFCHKEGLSPQNIKRHPITKEKICRTCYDYHKKAIRDREKIITHRKREEHETHCANAYCKQPLFPKKNALHPVTQERICKTCQKYYIRNGKDRELTTTRKVENDETKCANNICKQTLILGKIGVHPITKEKICKACYNYRKRSGKDRKVIVTRKKRENHETHCGNAYCKQPLFPKMNALLPGTQKRVCKTCYDYHKNTGREREVIITHRKREKHETHCANAYCKLQLLPKRSALHPVTQERICQACCIYYKRNGKDREIITTRKKANDETKNSETQEPQSETIHPNKNNDLYKKKPKQKFFDGEKCANTVCQQLLLPKHFRPHPVTKEKICMNCYYHYQKYRKDREVIITHRKREKHETNCSNTFCKQPLKRCHRHPVTQKLVCPACVTYYKRNGRDREVIKTRRKKEEHETHCANKFCKQFLLPKRSVVHPVTNERICDNCYHYYKRNGQDRELVAEKVKKLDRDRYESESDTTSISSNDSSIEESSDSDCESDSSETDFE